MRKLWIKARLSRSFGYLKVWSFRVAIHTREPPFNGIPPLRGRATESLERFEQPAGWWIKPSGKRTKLPTNVFASAICTHAFFAPHPSEQLGPAQANDSLELSSARSNQTGGGSRTNGGFCRTLDIRVLN